jgi:hypothetical protein
VKACRSATHLEGHSSNATASTKGIERHV